MTDLAALVLEEPLLEFRYGQKVADPRRGLELFGPFDTDSAVRPAGMTYAVVGRPEGISAFRTFSEDARRPIVSISYDEDPRRTLKDRLLWPPFPGVEAAFHVEWPKGPGWTGTINHGRLRTAIQHRDPHRRAFDSCNLYLDQIRIAFERDESFRVLVCVVPDEVFLACRPESRIVGGMGIRPRQTEVRIRRVQPDLFGAYSPAQYELSVDFRRQLKARAMEYGIPIQIVRESTIGVSDDKKRSLTPVSDRAWNLLTTFYYKAGGKPWRLATAREGVCYVGIAFKRAEATRDERTACCAAQMFLDTGDGVVFRGEFGPWYSPRSRQFRLDKKAAHELLEGVLAAYEQQGGRRLKEVFIHSRSEISAEEYAGYSSACPNGVRVVGVRVRRSNRVRAYRLGTRPVIRGTTLVAGSRRAYLWASGFVPEVLTYPGWEVPAPLELDVQFGDVDILQVAKDILGLTKLNYNACRLGDSQPVTVGFSDAVGEILVSNPTVAVRRPNFKFYI